MATTRFICAARHDLSIHNRKNVIRRGLLHTGLRLSLYWKPKESVNCERTELEGSPIYRHPSRRPAHTMAMLHHMGRLIVWVIQDLFDFTIDYFTVDRSGS